MTYWKTRASQVGYYVACPHRAHLDRIYHYGGGLPEHIQQEKDKPAPYANFGTCAHWMLQAKLNCLFPPLDRQGKAGASLVHTSDHKYTDDQLQGARALFGSKTEAMLEKVVDLGVRDMPDSPDSAPWMAETFWENEYLTGHIDFISQDLSTIIDLKTTTRPPTAGHIKPEHYYQMLAYSLIVGEQVEKAYIYYVSSKAEWTILSDVIDFTSKETSTDRYNLECFLKQVVEEPLPYSCPNLSACKSTYCPMGCGTRLAVARRAKPSEEKDDLNTGRSLFLF